MKYFNPVTTSIIVILIIIIVGGWLKYKRDQKAMPTVVGGTSGVSGTSGTTGTSPVAGR